MTDVKAWVAFLILLLVQIFLILMPILPFTDRLVELWASSTSPLEVTFSTIGIHTALLTLFFGYAYKGLFTEVHTEREQLLRIVAKHREVRPLRDDTFYKHISDAVSDAQSRVWIMYFSPRPPDTNNRNVQRYYTNAMKAVRKRSGVRFRRLIRMTDANRPWIGQIMERLKSCSNADIAVLDDSDTSEMPLALSTQLVDKDHTWLVAVKSHERSAEFRDVYVSGPEFNSIMDHYFERLWGRARVVLKDGCITEDGRTLLSEGKSA